jgi:predicted esterase
MPREFATQVSISSLVREERGVPGAPLVIALHGWGMSERSFARWMRAGIDADEGVSWWIPRGILPGQVESKRVGYGWYVFDGKDQDALKASMAEARAYLAGLADLARRRLSPERIVLAGFSQGGYCSSFTALTRPDLFDRLVCCCARPKSEFADDLAAARALEVMIQTGAQDKSVTPELIARGVAPLREAGLDVVERSYEAVHKVTPEMAVDIAGFAR